jgi:hypothetical protein
MLISTKSKQQFNYSAAGIPVPVFAFMGANSTQLLFADDLTKLRESTLVLLHRFDRIINSFYRQDLL